MPNNPSHKTGALKTTIASNSSKWLIIQAMASSNKIKKRKRIQVFVSTPGVDQIRWWKGRGKDGIKRQSGLFGPVSNSLEAAERKADRKSGAQPCLSL